MSFWKGLFRRNTPKAEDLAAADNSGPARRASARYPHSRVTFGEIIALPANTPVLFKVKDISLGGIGLVSPHNIPKGTFLAIKLQGFHHSRTLRARVVHSAQQSKTWLLGCVLLDKLRPEELEALL
jgi:hypothetical protein